MEKKLYKTSEVAQIYGVSSYTITHNWVPKGLPYLKGSKKGFLFDLEDVAKFIERQKNIRTESVQIDKNKSTIKYNKNICLLKVH